MDFIPQSSGSAESAVAGSIGRVRIDPIVPEELPVQVTSLLPLRMTVRSNEPALLETMRVFIPGWTAQVDGRDVPVQRSAEGLVAVEVPAGRSHVEVAYTGPLLLRVTFWANLSAAVSVVVAGLVWLIRRGRLPV